MGWFKAVFFLEICLACLTFGHEFSDSMDAELMKIPPLSEASLLNYSLSGNPTDLPPDLHPDQHLLDSNLAGSAPLQVMLVVSCQPGREFLEQEAVFGGLAAQLISEGHNTTAVLVAESESESTRELEIAEGTLQSAGARVLHLPPAPHAYSSTAEVRTALRVFEFLDTVKPTPDIAYFTDWQGLGHYCGLARRQGAGLPTTLLAALITGTRTARATFPAGHVLLASQTHLRISFMESSFLSHADLAIVPSTSSPLLAPLLGALPRGRTFAAPWPPVQNTLPDPVSSSIPTSPAPGSCSALREIVFVGSLEHASGLHLFCDAVDKMIQSAARRAPGGIRDCQLKNVTFIGADADVEVGAEFGGAEETVQGSDFVRAEAFKWFRSLPDLTVEIHREFTSQQTLEYLRQGGLTRLAVLASPVDAAVPWLTTLLQNNVPLIALDTGGSSSAFHLNDDNENTESGEVTSPLVPPRASALAAALHHRLVSQPGGKCPSPPIPPRPATSHLPAAISAQWATFHAHLTSRRDLLRSVEEEGHEGEGLRSCFSEEVETADVDEEEEEESEVMEKKSLKDSSRCAALDVELAKSSPPVPPAGVAEWPVVSVVVVHFDRPGLLTQVLSSLSDQNYPRDRLEVVLVDDGSTRTEAIDLLKQLEAETSWFSERGWKVVRQKNKYLGAARNTGWRAARGEWLLFMDDDNFAKPEEVLTLVRAGLHTSAGVVTCLNDFLPSPDQPPDHTTVPHGRFIPLGGDPATGMFENSFGDANALVHRRVLEELGGWAEEEAYGVQDWELFSRAVLLGHTLEVVPKALYWYRTNSNSMLRSATQSVNNHLHMRPYLHHPLGVVAAYLSSLHSSVAVKDTQLQELQRQLQTQDHFSTLLRQVHCSSLSSDPLAPTSPSDPTADNLVENADLNLWADPENMEAPPQWAEGGAAKAGAWEPHFMGYSFSFQGRIVPAAPGVPPQQQGMGALRVDLNNNGEIGGAWQFVEVQQQSAEQLILHGWSKILQISGYGSPIDYSIYADIHFQDGSKEWAFFAPFDPKKEGWQHAYGVIDHKKPVAGVSIVLLFRYRGGAVLFDDIELSTFAKGVCKLP